MGSESFPSSLPYHYNASKQTLLRLLSCPSLDGNVDRSNPDTKEPMHKPTSSRGWLGGMHGAMNKKSHFGDEGLLVLMGFLI